MKKQNFKKNEGITLISLVITIIVLLILAMVSINLVMNGGIIAHAQNAVEKYEIEEEKEINTLEKYEQLMNQYANPNNSAESVKYYILGESSIQKVDYNEKKIITCNSLGEDTDEWTKIESQVTFSSVDEEVEITLINGNKKTINTGSVKIVVEVEGSEVIGAYIQGGNLYGNAFDGTWAEFTEVTDQEEIENLEERITNIQ